MKRNKDYISDVVRDSIQETMTEVKDYFDKHWAPGKEYNVIAFIQKSLDKEIDKYLPHGAASNVYFSLSSYAREKNKYDKYYAKSQEKYGPYIMELLAEYAHSLSLTGRYDVGNRYQQVNDEIMKNMMNSVFSDDNIEAMIKAESENISKFLKQHGVENYTISMGSIGLAINVVGDIILDKKDAPRGTFKYEFNKVSGSFICKECDLKSLQFGPKEVGGDFDCSNNKLSSFDLNHAPIVVGGDFIWGSNEGKVTWTEIKKHSKVGGRIYTDAPMTPAEKEEFKQQIIKEQNVFLAEFKAKGRILDNAIQEENVEKIEECREYFFNAVNFFKERPWMTAQGMKISYQILMKIYAHLHKLSPEKYPDNILKEDCRISKLTEKDKYSYGETWL